MHACTIIALNYLAHARALTASIQSVHPDASVSVLVLDATVHGWDGDDEGFEVLTPGDLCLDLAEFHRMAMIYDVTELATAVKPWLLETLLSRDVESVLYLDPDIEVLASIDHLSRLAAEEGIALTPHLLAPSDGNGFSPGEAHVMLAGIYNLGFLGLGRGQEAFLSWWSRRLQRDCIIDPAGGLFVDQRYIDFVPVLFPYAQVNDPGCNVAYWNLESRDLHWTGDGYRVNNVPLRFFHFSGFDPRRPHLLSKHQGPVPAVKPTTSPALARLCWGYATTLLSLGFAEASEIPYGFESTPSGLAVDRRIRLLYRNALLAAELSGREGAVDDLPTPFGNGGDDHLVRWLCQPRPEAPCLPRYIAAIYDDRIDLQRAFPDPLGADLDGFERWIEDFGKAEEEIPGVLLEFDLRRPSPSDVLDPMVIPSTGLRSSADAARQSRASRADQPALAVSDELRSLIDAHSDHAGGYE